MINLKKALEKARQSEYVTFMTYINYKIVSKCLIFEVINKAIKYILFFNETFFFKSYLTFHFHNI